MKTCQCFSFSRLALVMKRDFMENWKTNLYRFLGPYAGLLLVMWFMAMNKFTFDDFSDVLAASFFSILLHNRCIVSRA